MLIESWGRDERREELGAVGRGQVGMLIGSVNCDSEMREIRRV